MTLETRQDKRPRYGPGMELARIIAKTGLWLTGWKPVGVLPPDRKMVVIGGPHTSNWDFLLLLAFTLHFRVHTRWVGKDALFRPPLGWFMRRVGGISVDRSKAGDTVSQIVAEFDNADDLILIITPEGTRGTVRRWKSGFYHIAAGAKVPIMIFYADYAKKHGGIGPLYYPSGDYDGDVDKMRAFFNGITPRNPERRAKHERASEHNEEQ